MEADFKVKWPNSLFSIILLNIVNLEAGVHGGSEAGSSCSLGRYNECQLLASCIIYART